MSHDQSTHICLVLDRSGSMQAVHADALGSVNSYVQAAKQGRALYEAKFSLITFNSEGIHTIRQNEMMETVRPMNSEEYRCSGLTPLYDAIGRGIGTLDEVLAGKTGDKAILVVMTDGHENASNEFSHATISKLIKARQEQGWLITFLGADLSVAEQGIQLGAHGHYVARFSGSKGLRAAGRVLASSSARFVQSADAGFTRRERAILREGDDELSKHLQEVQHGEKE